MLLSVLVACSSPEAPKPEPPSVPPTAPSAPLPEAPSRVAGPPVRFRVVNASADPALHDLTIVVAPGDGPPVEVANVAYGAATPVLEAPAGAELAASGVRLGRLEERDFLAPSDPAVVMTYIVSGAVAGDEFDVRAFPMPEWSPRDWEGEPVPDPPQDHLAFFVAWVDSPPLDVCVSTRSGTAVLEESLDLGHALAPFDTSYGIEHAWMGGPRTGGLHAERFTPGEPLDVVFRRGAENQEPCNGPIEARARIVQPSTRAFVVLTGLRNERARDLVVCPDPADGTSCTIVPVR